ncbi:radical SAM/SPASM domain-containing protein [Xanthobacter autotrophicus]|uniref:radical SAM/SPASM domain-containing protein n=1 Tax=Xanthobacter autotrophicus TaxID=280 RepID=UPI00372B9961
MESIYWSMSWACHRKCRHCYEDRFRPYVRDGLRTVIDEAIANFPRIVANLPDRMIYRDVGASAGSDDAPMEKTGRIVLSGGEALIDGIRENVTYPLIDALVSRYRDKGGVKIVVQTTGDLLTGPIVENLVTRGIYMIAVAGVDDFHVGLEGAERQSAFMERLAKMFSEAGLKPSGLSSETRKWHEEDGPLFSFFGATPGSWIGKLWPRGRAWMNDLSTATLEDNFCNRWSGGLNFLRHSHSGSEVSIEPSGDLYPCCVKTKAPLGNLLDDKLIDILDSLAQEPALKAISMGHPEQMGLAYGWSEETFLSRSRTKTPKGHEYANFCIGCDAFHEEILGPILVAAGERRRRNGSSTSSIIGGTHAAA